MAGLGLADDIMPWTPDTFGSEPAMPQVADTGGLGLAQQPGPGEPAPVGIDPGVARRTVQDESMGLPAPAAPVVPQTAPQPAAARRGGMSATDRQALLKQYAPQWDDDPIGAIAFIMQSIAAGMQGRELPADKLLKQAKEHEALQLQKAQVGMSLLEHAQKLTRTISDPAKRREAISGLKAQFGATLGSDFSKLLDATLSGQGMNSGALMAATEHAPLLLQLSGGDVESALKMAENKELMGRLDAQADRRNQTTIPTKLQTIQAFVQSAAEGKVPDADAQGAANFIAGLPKNARGQVMIPYAQLADLNGKLPAQFRLTDSEMRTLRTDDGLAIQSGIRPGSLDIKAEEGAITNQPEFIKIQNAIRAASASGDSAGVRAGQAALNKLLRSDPAEPVTLTDPATGEQRAFRKDSPELDRRMAQGWVPATGANTEIKGWISDKGNVFAGTNEQARRFGLKPLIPGSTITTTDPVTGLKTQTQVGPIGLADDPRFGQLDRIGAAAGPGPAMIGDLVAEPKPGETTAPAAPGAPAAPAEPTAAPLTTQAAGNAAPLVQPPNPAAAPVKPVTTDPAGTLTDRPIRQTFTPPAQALPEKVQEDLSFYRVGLENLRVMRDSKDLIGKDVTGVSTWIKQNLNVGDVFGAATRENKLAAALANYEVAAQALIKGIPSNKDAGLLSLTLPGVLNSSGQYEARVDTLTNITKQLLTDKLAFYKSTGIKVPAPMVEDLKQFGVNPDKVDAWNGKGNPNQKTIDVTVKAMPDAVLKEQAAAVVAGRMDASPEMKRAMAEELRRRKVK